MQEDAPPSLAARFNAMPMQKMARRREKVTLTAPLSGSTDDYISALTQNNIAWIFMGKGIQLADPQCLEIASGWLCNQLHKLGRCAKVYAKLRGSSTVNYVDMKQAIQDEFREEYSRLFHQTGFPNTRPFPLVIPKLTHPRSPIIASTHSWASIDNDFPVGEHNSLSFSTQSNRPLSIPSFLPMFPKEFLYKNTLRPWNIEEEKSPDRHLLFQKMELQVQIPQLHNPELHISDIFSSSYSSKSLQEQQENSFWGTSNSPENNSLPHST